MMDEGGWSRMGYRAWADLAEVRARLAAGANPDGDLRWHGRPLHMAAEWGSAEVVAELVARGADVEAVHAGRTPLWTAVHSGQPETARVLAAAGADPWRPMMAGWSPGRLSLASPTPDLFPLPPDASGPDRPPAFRLTDEERAAVAEAHRLLDAIGSPDYDGLSLCCVAGVGAAEAVHRLGATAVETDDPEAMAEALWDDSLTDDALLTVGVTDVEGGCVVTQPWAYGASTPVVSRLLSAGTVCYAMYANPKSGNQGHSVHDGVTLGWDLHPGGGWSEQDDPADEILRTFLYRHEALAYCCAYAGLKLADARPIVGPPDRWVRLPAGDYWAG